MMQVQQKHGGVCHRRSEQANTGGKTGDEKVGSNHRCDEDEDDVND